MQAVCAFALEVNRSKLQNETSEHERTVLIFRSILHQLLKWLLAQSSAACGRRAAQTVFALPQSSDSAHCISTAPELAIFSFQLEISLYLFTSNSFVNLTSLAVSGPWPSSARWRR